MTTNGNIGWIASYIWSIADDVLRDLYVRGKYRKADLLLRGEGEAADNIVGGPEYSTLANDAFPSREFGFMLSNPPYSKSWKTDLDRMGGKKEMRDPRFLIEHGGDPEYSLVTRSSDSQRRKAASKPSCAARSCPAPPTPGRQREDRLRDQLQPLLLQAEADADVGGGPGGRPGAGKRD